MKIFWDLDGPILDVSEKYFRVYKDLLESRNFKPVEKKEYWEHKRDKTPPPDILKLSKAESLITWYREKRKEIIESDQYLKYDRLQDGVLELLTLLKSGNEQILVTLRGNSGQLEKQLDYLGIKNLFADILVAEGGEEPKWKSKYRLVKDKYGSAETSVGAFIGDTETDILAGRHLGCETVGVLNGIRNRRRLEACQPDNLIEEIKMLKQLPIFERMC